MKTYDIGEYLSEFACGEEMKDGDEILITIDGRKICTVTPKFEVEEVSFKIKKSHC